MRCNGVSVSIAVITLVDGALRFDVEVLGGGKIGDLRGLFLNIADESLLSGLSVEGDDVTDSAFKANKVIDLGNGANMKGASRGFDLGVEFGKAGIGGGDDIRSTSFVLRHDSVALTNDLFEHQSLGLRLTSVGYEHGPRCDSLKIVAKVPELCDPEPPVNTPPQPDADAAKVCANQSVMIDVLDNDIDADGDALTITAVAGQSIVEGGSVTLASGAVVRLVEGELVYDLSGADDFDHLLIGATAQDSFEYTVSDGENTAAAAVEVTVCGAKNTVETIEASLPDMITFSLEVLEDIGRGLGDARITLSGSGDARLDGLVIDQVYCIDPPADFVNGAVVKANVYLGVAGSVPDGVIDRPENLDSIAWILNQDFGAIDNGDGAGETYTEAEIQAAIWRLTDGQEYLVPGVGTRSNASEIYNRALTEGDGFAAGEDDLMPLLLVPTQESAALTGHAQPLVFGVAFDDLRQDCLCGDEWIA